MPTLDRPARFSRRQAVFGSALLFAGPGAGSVLAEGPGGEKIRVYAATLITTTEQAEDARIAAEVRRRYVERIRFLGEQRGKNTVQGLDHELSIYSELLGIQHALGGPSGWFPS